MSMTTTTETADKARRGRTFLFFAFSRIILCLHSEKKRKALLNRFGAPGAFLNFIFGAFFAVVLLMMIDCDAKFWSSDFVSPNVV